MRILLFVSFLIVSHQTLAQDFSGDTTIARIEKLPSQKEKAIAFNREAGKAWSTGNLKGALEYSERGLKIAKKYKYKSLESELYNNRGIAYDYLSDYPSALKNFFAALSIQEKLNDPRIKGNVLGNIGLIYMNQEQNEKALNYHKRALKTGQLRNDSKAISASLNNIAIVYSNQKNYQKAIEYYEECIKIDIKANDTTGLGDDYNNISIPYLELKQYDVALDYLEKALKIRISDNDTNEMAVTYSNFGEVHYYLGDYNQARKYFKLSIQHAKTMNYRECLIYVYEWITKTEEAAGDSTSAFRYYKLYIAYRDSIDNSDIAREQTTLELNYEFDKEKEISRLREKEKDRQYKIILIAVSSGLILILLFSILFFRKWKQTQSQRKIIEEKNHLVQQKNDEITASISYAKRIQKAILPSTSAINEWFPHNFVLYLPKDIVSGDFYWIDEIDTIRYVAVADCTGHGVPGAIMSVVCHNALNQALNEFDKTNPSKILDKTRELVINQLSKDEDAVADGMDISLCAFHKNSNKMTWAGANNPLWIFRKSSNSLEEIKADKESIGNHEHPTPFKQHQLELNHGDRIFLFSDGYQDQFGGPKHKKMMRKGFKKAIMNSIELPIKEQNKFLMKAFRNWQATDEQVDDVCVIGIEWIT